MCRCNFFSLCSEKNLYECFILRQPVKLFTKNDTACEFFTNFSQIFSQIVKFFVKNFVKFSVSFQRKNTRASSFYHCFTILRSRRCGIIYTHFHAFHLHMNVELFLNAFVQLYGRENQVC